MSDIVFPIEYYGVESPIYPSPTIFETISTYPISISFSNIIKVYVSSKLTESFCYKNNITLLLCKVTFNIEYIDKNKNDTLSVLRNYIYTTIQYKEINPLDEIDIKTLVGNIDLAIVDEHSLYVHLELYPY